MEDLQAALEQFAHIEADLEGKSDRSGRQVSGLERQDGPSVTEVEFVD